MRGREEGERKGEREKKEDALAIGAGAKKAMKRPSTQSESVAAARGRWRTKVETALGR